MSDTIAAGQLRAFIERIERIESDIKDMNADKSETYKEARGVGFDVKAIRQCVSARKLDGAELAERNAMFDLYWEALNGAHHVHVHEEQNSSGKASGSIDPSAGHVSPPARIRKSGSGSANTGGEDEVNDRKLNTTTDGPDEGKTSLAAREGEQAAAPIPDEDVPAFLKKDRPPLRPHCLYPHDLEKCAGSGREHCHACKKAMAENEVAA